MVQSEQSLERIPGKSRLGLELRKFEPSEYERLAQIRNPLFPDQEYSPEEMRAFDDSLDKTKYYFQRYSCFNKDTGEMVGGGNIGHVPWMFNPTRYQGSVLVDKQYQNKDVGQFIYENLLRFLEDLKAKELWGFAK